MNRYIDKKKHKTLYISWEHAISEPIIDNTHCIQVHRILKYEVGWRMNVPLNYLGHRWCRFEPNWQQVITEPMMIFSQYNSMERES